MPNLAYNNSGTYSNATDIQQNVAGTWTRAQKGFMNVSGTWTLFFQYATIPGTPVISATSTTYSCTGASCATSYTFSASVTSSGGVPAPTIYYTTDGTTPTTSSSSVANGGTISVTCTQNTVTLQCMAHNVAGSSAVASQAFTYSWIPDVPVISGAAAYSCDGSCAQPYAETITLNCPGGNGTPAVTIFYEEYVNGVWATSYTSIANGGSFTLNIYQNTDGYVRCYATNLNGTSSTVTYGPYHYTYTHVPATPTITGGAAYSCNNSCANPHPETLTIAASGCVPSTACQIYYRLYVNNAWGAWVGPTTTTSLTATLNIYQNLNGYAQAYAVNHTTGATSATLQVGPYLYTYTHDPSAPSITGGAAYSCVGSSCGQPINEQIYWTSSGAVPDNYYYIQYYANGAWSGVIGPYARNSGASYTGAYPIYRNTDGYWWGYATNTTTGIASAATQVGPYHYTWQTGIPNAPAISWTQGGPANITCTWCRNSGTAADCPTSETWTAVMTSSSANGGGGITIYYTTDGSDPINSGTRGAVGNGGAVNVVVTVSATTGSAAITLYCRAYTAYGWSGLVGQSFGYTKSSASC